MRATVLAIALALLAPLVAFAPGSRAQAPLGRDAAATENELGTRDAIAQMKAGGNAVDAAVCAALIGGVASPSSSGIGGGGFALVFIADGAKVSLLDFRETAAQGVDAPAFE